MIYIKNLLNRVTSDLVLLKKEETTNKVTHKNIKLTESRPDILYRLGKSAQGDQEWSTTFPYNFVSY